METKLTEKYVMDWMRSRIRGGQFQDAASLAREFLQENQIDDVLSPDFRLVMDAGFKMVDEIAGQR